MRSNEYDDINIVSPLRLVLRALRGPVLFLASLCVFVDRYGLPTVQTNYRYVNGLVQRSVTGYSLEFRKLERSAALEARDWLLGQEE